MHLTIDADAQIEFINGAVGFLTHNYGTILGGIFNEGVNNRSGTISDGTFNWNVSNVEGAIISGGTFNSRVMSKESTILGGEFYKEVINSTGTTISNGEFYAKVTNYGVITNLIAKNGFYVNPNSTSNFEQITIVDNGVNIDKASFDKINNIEVAKDAKVIFSDVSVDEAKAKTTGKGLMQIDGKDYTTDGTTEDIYIYT